MVRWFHKIRIGLDRTGSDWIGLDRTGSDRTGPDRTGLDHGSNNVRNFARQAEIKSAWHNGAQAPLEVFFLPKKTLYSNFHGCVEYCCVVPPWTKGRKNFQMDLHSIMSRRIYFTLAEKPLKTAFRSCRLIIKGGAVYCVRLTPSSSVYPNTTRKLYKGV